MTTAAPAFASSTTRISVVPGVAQKYSQASTKGVRWTITITNTGTTRIGSLYLDYSWFGANGSAAAVNTFVGTATPPTFSVVNVATMTANWVGTSPALAPNGVLTVSIDATGPDNSGGTMSVIIRSPDVGGTQIGSTSSNIS